MEDFNGKFDIIEKYREIFYIGIGKEIRERMLVNQEILVRIEEQYVIGKFRIQYEK